MSLNTSNNFASSSSSLLFRERSRNPVISGVIGLPRHFEIGLLGFIEVFGCWWVVSLLSGCNCI